MQGTKITGLPAGHPDADTIQILVDRIINVTQDQKASAVLSSLFSIYRHGLLKHPEHHGIAIKHLAQLVDELQLLTAGQAPAERAPAVATAPPIGSVPISPDELNPELAVVVERLAAFITSQGWRHQEVLPALAYLFCKTAQVHACCLSHSVDVLQCAADLLRTHLQSLPEAERAGHPLH